MDGDNLLQRIPQGILSGLFSLSQHGSQAVEMGLILFQHGQTASLDGLYREGYSTSDIAQRLCAFRQSQRGQFANPDSSAILSLCMSARVAARIGECLGSCPLSPPQTAKG